MHCRKHWPLTVDTEAAAAAAGSRNQLASDEADDDDDDDDDDVPGTIFVSAAYRLCGVKMS